MVGFLKENTTSFSKNFQRLKFYSRVLKVTNVFKINTDSFNHGLGKSGVEEGEQVGIWALLGIRVIFACNVLANKLQKGVDRFRIPCKSNGQNSVKSIGFMRYLKFWVGLY
jgi:c-di-GMP-binding flagellar brake protein YcgR